MAEYSRKSPSQRYIELLSLYQQMHQEGEPALNLAPEDTFAGASLPRQVIQIRRLIQAFKARSLLDYGCGKGKQYALRDLKLENGATVSSIADYWGNPEISRYDPGYAPFSTLPDGRFDGVICTDVLEHCPEEDIPWILDELFSYANKFVFANVACYPAQKHLPNGENAHTTIKSVDWWKSTIKASARRRKSVAHFFILEGERHDPDGTRRTENVVQASPSAHWARLRGKLLELRS